jgi:hypothetical protein
MRGQSKPKCSDNVSRSLIHDTMIIATPQKQHPQVSIRLVTRVVPRTHDVVLPAARKSNSNGQSQIGITSTTFLYWLWMNLLLGRSSCTLLIGEPWVCSKDVTTIHTVGPVEPVGQLTGSQFSMRRSINSTSRTWLKLESDDSIYLQRHVELTVL